MSTIHHCDFCGQQMDDVDAFTRINSGKVLIKGIEAWLEAKVIWNTDGHGPDMCKKCITAEFKKFLNL